MGCILLIICMLISSRFANFFGDFLVTLLGEELALIVGVPWVLLLWFCIQKKITERENQRRFEELNKDSMEKYKKLLSEKSIYECPNCGEKFEYDKYTFGVRCPNCKKLFITKDSSIYFDEEIDIEILENYIYAVSGGIGWFQTYWHGYGVYGAEIFLSLYGTINKKSVQAFRKKIFKSELIEEIFKSGFKTARYSEIDEEFLCIRNTMKFFNKKEHKEIIVTIFSSINLMSIYNYGRYISTEEEEIKFNQNMNFIKANIQECLFGTENFRKLQKLWEKNFEDQDFMLTLLSGIMLGLADREREESYTKENNEEESKVYSNKNKYYNILNLNESATMEEVKKSYRKLVKMYHPDKYISKNISEEEMKKVELKFIEIQEAYEKIKDLRNE